MKKNIEGQIEKQAKHTVIRQLYVVGDLVGTFAQVVERLATNTNAMAKNLVVIVLLLKKKTVSKEKEVK